MKNPKPYLDTMISLGVVWSHDGNLYRRYSWLHIFDVNILSLPNLLNSFSSVDSRIATTMDWHYRYGGTLTWKERKASRMV